MTGTSASESAFERSLPRLMVAGVWLSAVCLAAGLASLLVSSQPTYADALLRGGLLILMATPGLRVALSVAEAVRARDWFWLWTTVAVALILTGTVLYSLAAL